MERISRDELGMRMAHLISLRGTCKRLQVGAIATMDGRIIATGYNGKVGLNTCENTLCDITKPCMDAVHAEQNLIAFSARHGISLLGSTLYVTDMPCLSCANSIIQAGVDTVFYDRPYRVENGVIQLQINGVHTYQLNLN